MVTKPLSSECFFKLASYVTTSPEEIIVRRNFCMKKFLRKMFLQELFTNLYLICEIKFFKF